MQKSDLPETTKASLGPQTTNPQVILQKYSLENTNMWPNRFLFQRKDPFSPLLPRFASQFVSHFGLERSATNSNLWPDTNTFKSASQKLHFWPVTKTLYALRNGDRNWHFEKSGKCVFLRVFPLPWILIILVREKGETASVFPSWVREASFSFPWLERRGCEAEKKKIRGCCQKRRRRGRTGDTE